MIESLSPEIKAYNDRSLGPPELLLAELDPALGDCLVFSEPGLLASPDELLLAGLCGTPTGEHRILLLRFERAGRTWSLLGQVLWPADARALDPAFETFSAPDLFRQAGQAYLMATPAIADFYTGCVGYHLDPASGRLLDHDKDGHPDPVFAVFSEPGSFHGACGYSPAAALPGVWMSRAFLDQSPIFRLLPTGIAP